MTNHFDGTSLGIGRIEQPILTIIPYRFWDSCDALLVYFPYNYLCREENFILDNLVEALEKTQSLEDFSNSLQGTSVFRGNYQIDVC